MGYVRWSYPDAMLREVRAGLLADERHPAIAQEAAQAIVETLLRAPHLEHVWRCKWDQVAEKITSAVWIASGTRSSAMFSSHDLRPGEIMLHNHPASGAAESHLLTPSEADCEMAHGLADRGIGAAIITNDQTQFVLFRAPGFAHRETTVKQWRAEWLGLAVSIGTQTTTTRSKAP